MDFHLQVQTMPNINRLLSSLIKKKSLMKIIKELNKFLYYLYNRYIIYTSNK